MRSFLSKERSGEDWMSTLGINPMGSRPSSPTDGPKGHDVDAGLFNSVAGGSCDDTRDGITTKYNKGALYDMNAKAMIEGELQRPGGRTEKVRGEAKARVSAATTICILLGVCTAGSWLGQGHAARE
ncbi:hypothetical protein TrRE_jg10328, partial [Triparma retinervis]